MLLKSLFMGNFGLFRGRLVELGHGLNLIFGPNESGKTTLVDAIVMSLLGRAQKSGAELKSIPRALAALKDRYGADISVQLAIIHQGREHQFPGPENSQDLWGLGWDELRAIFIAREGELELAPGEARQFRAWWEALKGRLLGFPEDPRKVLGKIAAEADLTDNLGLTVMQKNRRHEVQEKLSWFEQNEERIAALRSLEKDYQALRSQEGQLAAQVERAEKGLLKSKLLRAKEIYGQMELARRRLREEYGRYSENDVQEWELLAKNSDKQTAQVQWLRQQHQKEEAKRQETIAAAADLARRIKGLSDKLRAAAEREQELAEVAVEDSKPRTGGLPGWSPWAAWAMALLALILGAHSDALGMVIVGACLVALALLLTVVQRRDQGRRISFIRRRQALLNWGREIGLDADTLPDLLKKKMDLQQEKDELEGQRQVLEGQLPGLARAVDDLSRQEGVQTAEIDKIRDQIGRLRDRAGLADLEDLKKRLQTKNELASDIDKKYQGGLRALLGSDEKSWAREMSQLEAMAGIEPLDDQEPITRLRAQLDKCRRDHQERYERMTHLAAELKAMFGLQRPEEVAWQVSDLRQEMRQLEILEHAGQRVRETFDRILQKSDTLLDEIIAGQTVSGGFAAITAGKYTAVSMKDLSLTVTDRGGREWGFSALSSGTRDQLLMVLRLALAERLLQSKGFFILDDPLVTSDRIRLREQMNMLGRLAGDGWQILLLTAQEEIRQEAQRLLEDGTDVVFEEL